MKKIIPAKKNYYLEYFLIDDEILMGHFNKTRFFNLLSGSVLMRKFPLLVMDSDNEVSYIWMQKPAISQQCNLITQANTVNATNSIITASFKEKHLISDRPITYTRDNQ